MNKKGKIEMSHQYIPIGSGALWIVRNKDWNLEEWRDWVEREKCLYFSENKWAREDIPIKLG